jgi:glycosyltransferase involved in cell wall biosynthesis
LQPLTLSVIVPVYNGTDDLQRCLAALAASHYSAFDVLVVDDGSTEPVEPVVHAYGFAYRRLDGPQGPAQARNLGAAHFHAVNPELVIFARCLRRNDSLTGPVDSRTAYRRTCDGP